MLHLQTMHMLGHSHSRIVLSRRCIINLRCPAIACASTAHTQPLAAPARMPTSSPNMLACSQGFHSAAVAAAAADHGASQVTTPIIELDTSSTPITFLAANVQPVQAPYPGIEQLPFYSQFPLDRQPELRRDSKQLDALFHNPQAKLIPLKGSEVLVQLTRAPSTDAPQSPGRAKRVLIPVALYPAAAAVTKYATSSEADIIYLGVDANGCPYFAAEVTDPDAVLKDAQQATSSSSSSSSTARSTCCWITARTAGQDLEPESAALLAVASGLNQWHASSVYHPRTGSRTRSTSGGFTRKCTSTSGSVYPRVDPAVITLVTAGQASQKPLPTAQWWGNPSPPHHMLNDWCLLGRKAEWPPGRYSTLAGFMEVGEPLEVTVAREVQEESGVQVHLPSVTYTESQPWPFPRSLMVGFYACAAPTALQPHAATLATGSSSAVSGQHASRAADQGNGGGVLGVAPTVASGYDLLPPKGRAAAMDVGLMPVEVDQVLLPQLPAVRADKEELEDCRWFHRDWLRACVLARPGQAVPQSKGAFEIPGRWSLAYRLITAWLYYPAPPPFANQGATDGSSGTDSSDETGPVWGNAWAGDSVPQVAIDEGVFKYVLMRLREPHSGPNVRHKLLVWGDTRAAYHMNVYQQAKAMASKLGLSVDVLGGGRIEHYPQQGIVSIYGYSAAFGPAPHEVTAALIRKWYPFYSPDGITVSYEGY